MLGFCLRFEPPAKNPPCEFLRVIVASHDEELPTVSENNSVLINHAPQTEPAEKVKQAETDNSMSSERDDTASFEES